MAGGWRKEANLNLQTAGNEAGTWQNKWKAGKEHRNPEKPLKNQPDF